MHPLTDNHRPFGQFEVIASRGGLPTALHLASNTLIHSRIDPAAEAADVARAGLKPATTDTLIIGGGLGYLPEAVLQSKPDAHQVWVLEFDPALYAIGRKARPSAPYYTSPSIHVIFATTPCSLLPQLNALPKNADLIISPYLLRLIEHEQYPLSDLMHILRAEQSSRNVYDPLIAEHAAATCERRAHLSRAADLRLSSEGMIVVTGAGPSLDGCLPFLQEHRAAIAVIAASGSVPALQNGGIEPDWIIALEAKESILRDLTDVTDRSSVIVFPSTHPDIFGIGARQWVNGSTETEQWLETRGGSSVIPALDLALQASSAPVIIVGVDLGYQSGAYAAASKREETPVALRGLTPPKFAAMRAGLERVLANPRYAQRRVYHVRESGVPLKGATRLTPQDLSVFVGTVINLPK